MVTTNKVSSAAGRRPQPIKVSRWPKTVPKQDIFMLISIALVLLGLIFIIGGVCFHLGYFRIPMVYWTTFSSGIYAAVPSGSGLLFLGISLQLPPPNFIGTLFFNVALFLLLLGIILGLTMPQFITPWWLRYLREEYEEWYILHILMKNAARDYARWKERTKTMDGLVNWAGEVQRKTRIEEA